MKNKILDLRAYFIAGPQDFQKLSIDDAIDKISVIIKSGVTVYQFRDKGTIYKNNNQRLEVAKRLQGVAQKAAVSFIVNDDVELARELSADGIHVGQDDDSVSKIRELIGQEMWVGLSVSNDMELESAQKSGADYLGIGPIYPTNSKSDAAEPIGIDHLRKMLEHNQLPTVGIGGITENSLTELSKIGLGGVAVISLLTESENYKNMVQKIKQNIR
ncbi:thiamine phosphate synthase [Lactococcus lactis]|jgi:thiamine-phosphate pyrophosphorylase|uniref:thiamine phosphate synthase n=1 Tax=Lactococcus lactis TaxID=1358 RepID=UPI00071E1B83|nr:thiamine phosphate synthase [Lactococcus lactis]KST79739.1 Thiamin-phosphate pyrophosphorylase [Lactococcus lactis subsp. lactis]MCT0051855.1 thiamine phosphate synthase [Lactococcus lactis subsp. lactis]MDG4969619.1 thiamine phosphate synthase [Lactococcus lactis]MDG5103475.1 thiamine phosphate synthase [Lactococcus lactis]WEA54115.1 thiamine phosphate synthase [Lactococcus lactis]